jgi:hypothetical protein
MDSLDSLVEDLIGLGFPQDFRKGKDWGYGVDLRQEQGFRRDMYLTPEAVERLLSSGNLIPRSQALNWEPNMHYFPDCVWFGTLDKPSQWKAPVYAWVMPFDLTSSDQYEDNFPLIPASDVLYKVAGQIPNLNLGFGGGEYSAHYEPMPHKMISAVHNDIEEWLNGLRG